MASIGAIQNKAQSILSVASITPTIDVGILATQVNGAKQSSAESFLFHIEEDNTVTLTSDITDHYVEDNTAIQDQISLKPEMITVRGFIGEVNDVLPKKLQFLKDAANKLTTVSDFAPEIAATALRAYTIAGQAYAIAAEVAATAKNLMATVTGKNKEPVADPDTGLLVYPTQNKQQTAFTTFYNYWAKRTLFKVQTPWAIFEDMAIQSIRAEQDAETRVISSFEITFKKMRFAQSLTTGKPLSGSGRFKTDAMSELNMGTSVPTLVA